MNSLFQRNVWSVFIFTMVVLAAVRVTAYTSVIGFEEAAKASQDSNAVINTAGNLLKLMADVDAGAEGYSLTGLDLFLERWQTAVKMLPAETRQLRILVRDDPARKRQMQRLESLIAERLAVSRQEIEQRRAEGTAATVQEPASGEGKRLSDEIRGAIGEMKGHERSFLTELDRNLKARIRTAKTVIVVGSGVAFVVLVLAMVIVFKADRSRTKAETSLREANDTLEQRVEERTAQLLTTAESLKSQVEHSLRLEDARRESEERFGTAFDQAGTGMALVGSDGRFLKVNGALCDFLGYTEPELLARTFRDTTHPDELHIDVANVRKLWAEEIPSYRREKRYLHKSGRPVWGSMAAAIVRDKGGRPLYHVVHVQDVTDHKIAMDALRERESELKAAQRIARTGSFRWVRETDSTLWSEEIYTIFGLNPGAPPPRLAEISRYLTPESWTEVERNVQHSLETGEGFELELEIVRPDGGHRIAFLQLTALGNEQGRIDRLRGTLRDITEQKRLEEQFRQAQKMEAVGRLAGGVAHDFHNLMMVINGYCALMLRRLDAQDPMHEEVSEIKKAGERATALTQQLLAFGRKQIIQPRVLDVNQVIRNAAKMLGRLLGEDIELVTVLRPDLGSVMADPAQLDQVLMNLALNARDAMPDGGQLRIETRNIDLEPVPAHERPEIEPGPYVQLTISDSGVGMDRETQAHIFEPFFTTKEIGKGTGLGLATVYGVIKQSRGYIRVHSEPGQGAAFEICLPRIEGPAPAITAVEQSRPAARELRGKETILLVEDQKQIRKLAHSVLQEHGYTVLEAANAEEAQFQSGRYAGTIHLLLADMVMPRMSGRELAGQLLTSRPGMKVLYMSGYTEDVAAQRAVPETGVAYLQKPIAPDDLALRVRECLDLSIN